MAPPGTNCNSNCWIVFLLNALNLKVNNVEYPRFRQPYPHRHIALRLLNWKMMWSKNEIEFKHSPPIYKTKIIRFCQDTGANKQTGNCVHLALAHWQTLWMGLMSTNYPVCTSMQLHFGSFLLPFVGHSTYNWPWLQEMAAILNPSTEHMDGRRRCGLTSGNGGATRSH